MKYLLFSLALLLVGCTDMDERFDSSYIGDPIEYAIEGVTASRAALVTTENVATLFPAMTVDAVGSDGVVFSDIIKTSTLQPSTVRYWTDDSYVFYSYPEGALNPVAASGNMTFEYTVGTDATTTPDIVVAREEVSRGNKVVFNYQHVFTAVCVKYESLLEAHRINSVKVRNSCVTGTCKVKKDITTGGTCAEWTNLNTPSDLVDTEAKVVLYNGQFITKDGYIFMTIPGQDINIEVVIDGKTVTAGCENPSSTGGSLVTFTINDDYTITVNDGTVLNKTVAENSDGTYNITLEAYVTGMVKTKTVTRPTNTVLVLDASGSMLDPLTSSPELASDDDCSKLDKSKPEGYYSARVSGLWSVYRPVRWNGSKWQYYNQTLGDWYAIEGNLRAISVYKSKMGAMMDACINFVNALKATGSEHLVSIVAFPGDDNDNARTLACQLDVRTDYAALISAIVSLRADDATPADKGLTMAFQLMKASGYVNNIIFMTDGDPNHSSGFDSDVANVAITQANNCKVEYAANVFTIGIFNSDATSNGKAFMERVSSNYKDATTYRNGVKVDDGFYHIVSTEAAIKELVSRISETVKEGGASIQLGTDSYIMDIVSDVFYAPAGSQIVLKQADYDESTKSFGSEYDVDSEVKYRIDGNSVYVTGFDYSLHFCGTGNTDGGRKIVIHINNLRVNPDNYTPGSKTNGYGSGLYSNDYVLISAFSSPEI